MPARHLIASSLLAVAVGCLAAAPAAAFCIENRADQALTFTVDIDGAGDNAPYVRILAPGEQGCCDWQRYDCNSSGRRDAILKFSVVRQVGGRESICRGSFEASDEFYIEARADRGECHWGLTTNRSGWQLWNHFKDRLARLLDWMIDQILG